MPQFAFIAKDRMGNTVQGAVEAQDLAFAANQVGQMGYSLVDLRPSPPPPPEPTTAFTPPTAGRDASPLDGRTIPLPAGAPASPSRSAVERTQAFPPTVLPAATSQAHAAAGAPGSLTGSLTEDLLKADADKRRKLEMDLARMGMKSDEIKRLLDASANTTAPPPVSATTYVPAATPVLPVIDTRAPKKANAHLKVAARAADLHSFAAQLQSSSAANRVQAIEAVTLDLPEFRDSTVQERQQAEGMLREVFALRKREKYAEAITKCREALGLVPSDAAALEMYGDLLQGVARTNEAMAAYKRATEADPKRVSAERKYGDLLMRQGKWQEPDTEEVSRNPIAAAAFSLLIPGAGQIHNGEKLKGAVLLACAAVAMAGLLFLMRDKAPWSTSSDLKPAAGTTRSKRVPVDWTAEAPVIGCVLFYTVLGIGSAFDAAMVAARNRRPN